MKNINMYQPENKKVEQEKPLCQFEFHEMTSEKVPQDIKEGIQKAMTILWQDEVNQPATFKVTFCDNIVNPNSSEPTNMHSCYDIDTDEFIFAMESTKKVMAPALNLPLNVTLTLLAAHEAVHKAQLFRNDIEKTTFDESLNFKESYWHSRHEIEAWEKAMTVFKKIFPNASGYIRVADKKYKLPE